MNEILFNIDIFPLKKNPIKGIFVTLLIFFLAFIVFKLTSSPVFTAFAFLFLLLDLNSFFFPTKYTVFKSKVDKKSLFGKKSFTIARFKNVINCRDGILLSPYRSRSMLEKIRGLYIICFDATQKEKLLFFFKDKIEQ